MEFYDVKTRSKVNVPDGEIKKKKMDTGKQIRYAVTATKDGRKLYKFVSEKTFKELQVPEE